MLGGGLGDILGRNIKPKQEKKSESLKIRNSEMWDVIVQLGPTRRGHPSLSYFFFNGVCPYSQSQWGPKQHWKYILLCYVLGKATMQRNIMSLP